MLVSSDRRQIPAHRELLALSSPKLALLIEEQQKDLGPGRALVQVDMPYPFDIVVALLAFAYPGSGGTHLFQAPLETIVQVTHAANEFEVAGVREFVGALLKLR